MPPSTPPPTGSCSTWPALRSTCWRRTGSSITPQARSPARASSAFRRSRRGGPSRPSPTVGAAGALRSVSDDLDEPAAIALAVQLEEEHALPGAEAELALADRDRLAGAAEQHGHAVGVAVPEVHVLGADVLGAAIPVVVCVVRLGRNEPLEQAGEVLQEAALELVHPDAARGVGRVDARDPVAHPARADGFR